MYNRSINQTDVSQMMYNYNYIKGKNRKVIGNVCLIGGGVLSIVGFGVGYLYDSNIGEGFMCAAAGAPLLFTGISFKINSKHLMKPPEAYMRDAGGNSVGMELDLGATGNGAGMALRF